MAYPYLSDRPVGEDAYLHAHGCLEPGERGPACLQPRQANHGYSTTRHSSLRGISYVVQFLGGDRWFLVRSTIVVNVLLMLVLARQIGFIARALVVDREAQRLTCALGVVTTPPACGSFGLLPTGSKPASTGSSSRARVADLTSR